MAAGPRRRRRRRPPGRLQAGRRTGASSSMLSGSITDGWGRGGALCGDWVMKAGPGVLTGAAGGTGEAGWGPMRRPRGPQALQRTRGTAWRAHAARGLLLQPASARSQCRAFAVDNQLAAGAPVKFSRVSSRSSSLEQPGAPAAWSSQHGALPGDRGRSAGLPPCRRAGLPSPAHGPPCPPPAPPALQQDSLPFLATPHDALRQGLVTLKDGAAASHPVEQIQRLAGPAGEQARLEMLRNVYGTALPARMQIEKQILDRCGRGRGGGRRRAVVCRWQPPTASMAACQCVGQVASWRQTRWRRQ